MIMRLVVTLIGLLALTACFAEESDTMEMPEGWNRLCLGYNTLALPPMLNVAQMTAEVEFANFDVVPAAGLDPRTYLRGRLGAANVLFETEANGWTYISASKTSRFVILAAAKQVGNDLAVVAADASRSVVGDGRDTDILQLVAGMDVVPLAQKRRQSGFCFQNVAFLYDQPKLQARFTLLASDALPGATVNNDNVLSLTFDNTPPVAGSDPRPPAPAPDASALLAQLERKVEPFQIGRFDAELVTLSGTDRGQFFALHDGFVAGTPTPGALPYVFIRLSERGISDPVPGARLVKSVMQSVQPN